MRKAHRYTRVRKKCMWKREQQTEAEEESERKKSERKSKRHRGRRREEATWSNPRQGFAPARSSLLMKSRREHHSDASEIGRQRRDSPLSERTSDREQKLSEA